MNLSQTEWQTVCLCICVFVSWTKKKRQKADEIYQRPWNVAQDVIPTFIDYRALVVRVVRLCWFYKHPGDWFAPVWSMLPQVKRAVPWVRYLLFLAARGILSLAEVSLSCNAGHLDNVKLSTSFCFSYLRTMIPFSSPFFAPPPPIKSHPIRFRAVTSPPISPSGWTHARIGVKINNIVSTLSQFSIKDFEVRLSRRLHHNSSASESSSPGATAEEQQQRFHNHTANTPRCAKCHSAAVQESEDMTVCLRDLFISILKNRDTKYKKSKTWHYRAISLLIYFCHYLSLISCLHCSMGLFFIIKVTTIEGSYSRKTVEDAL